MPAQPIIKLKFMINNKNKNKNKNEALQRHQLEMFEWKENI